tara:strand:+ start:120 stop:551 length:432 start_codon:yes stop_codon:yes gene_type:complete
MIINCNKCNKKFKVNDNLIPSEGRLLKCGNCGNSWFFNKNNEEYKDINEINNPVNQNNKNEIKINKNINKIKQSTSNKNKQENSLKYFFNYFIVILILFMSIILVVDTFETQISLILPGIIPLLDNLYATLYDLQLFIKDLFN